MKKKTNIRTVIRRIVREEVAMAIQEVITELKQPSQPQQKSEKIVEKKSFTKDLATRLGLSFELGSFLQWHPKASKNLP